MQNMKKIDSMTEEEFTKAALEKGFDEHWIKSCINDCPLALSSIKTTIGLYFLTKFKVSFFNSGYSSHFLTTSIK